MTYATKRKVAGMVFLLPYLLSFCSFVILPLIVAFVLAFCRYDLTARGQAGFVGTKNFSDAFADQYFWAAMGATVRYAILIVPATLLTALALALGMNAMVRGQRFVRAMVFLPGMLNVAVTGILWQWFFNGQFGLFNFFLEKVGIGKVPWLSEKTMAMPSITLMSLWWTVGGTSIVLLTALQQIPVQLFEAAALDGADTNRLFKYITIPMLKPVLTFTVVTTTIGGFQMFGQAFMLTRGGPELSTRGLVQYIYETAFNNYRLGYGAAMSWLLFIVIATFAIIQFRVIRGKAI